MADALRWQDVVSELMETFGVLESRGDLGTFVADGDPTWLLVQSMEGNWFVLKVWRARDTAEVQQGSGPSKSQPEVRAELADMMRPAITKDAGTAAALEATRGFKLPPADEIPPEGVHLVAPPSGPVHEDSPADIARVAALARELLRVDPSTVVYPSKHRLVQAYTNRRITAAEMGASWRVLDDVDAVLKSSSDSGLVDAAMALHRKVREWLAKRTGQTIF